MDDEVLWNQCHDIRLIRVPKSSETGSLRWCGLSAEHGCTPFMRMGKFDGKLSACVTEPERGEVVPDVGNLTG